jgi:nitrogen-specific signal transduction histidine kinase
VRFGFSCFCTQVKPGKFHHVLSLRSKVACDWGQQAFLPYSIFSECIVARGGSGIGLMIAKYLVEAHGG